MLSDTQINKDRLLPDAAKLNDYDQFSKKYCRTRVILDDFYLCQEYRFDCEHAFPFGTSYLCRSTRRAGFSSTPTAINSTNWEIL
jgi:hypothetical protein